MTAVADDLRQLLVDRFDVDPGILNDDVTLAKAGVDSLAAIDLIIVIEQRFGITLGEQDIDSAQTLVKLVEVIEALRAKELQTSRS